MNESLLKIAETVIARADAERPADAVLREELRKQRGLSRDDSWEISRAVFTFYRWFGWIEPRQPMARKIGDALSLAEEFGHYPEKFSDQDLVKKSVPDWIHQQVTIVPALARAFQGEPKIWLRSKRGQREELARKLRYCEFPKSPLLADALEYGGSIDLFRIPEFHNGEFELQDITSQAVSVICDPKPAQTWWDACAGEGGKTLHLSELMENKGLIWASDRAEWRLKKLKQRTARAKAFNYRAALWDGGEKLPTKTKFDGVLIDAPCSGVGTWLRNPHARWTTTIEDVRELSEIQRKLLRNAAASVKPGGKLIYSVCTLTESETNEVCNFFESEVTGFKPMLIPNPIQPNEAKQSRVWLWPQVCGGNGMFVAAWSRTS